MSIPIPDSTGYSLGIYISAYFVLQAFQSLATDYVSIGNDNNRFQLPKTVLNESTVQFKLRHMEAITSGSISIPSLKGAGSSFACISHQH